MRQTNALQDLLSDLTRVFNDERVPVNFTTSQSSAAIDGSYVNIATNMKSVYGVDVEKAQELRLIVDHLSHEIEHIRESDLRSKERFVAYYDNRAETWMYSNLAGDVINILEDVYIDAKRIERYPGLRGAHAFFVQSQVGRGVKVSGSTPFVRRLISGFWTVAHAGYAPGIEDAEPELRAALAKIRVIADRIRHVDDPDDRYDLAHDAMAVLLDVLPPSPSKADLDEIEEAVSKFGGDERPRPTTSSDGVGDEPGERDPDDAEADAASAEADADGDEDATDEMDANDAENDSTMDGGDTPADGDGETSDASRVESGRPLPDLLSGADPSEATLTSR